MYFKYINKNRLSLSYKIKITNTTNIDNLFQFKVLAIIMFMNCSVSKINRLISTSNQT